MYIAANSFVELLDIMGPWEPINKTLNQNEKTSLFKKIKPNWHIM